ncbi:MAG: hypothetical protein MJ252_26180 [archaeon]|nr:hypothetical protein [archaeon]
MDYQTEIQNQNKVNEDQNIINNTSLNKENNSQPIQSNLENTGGIKIISPAPKNISSPMKQNFNLFNSVPKNNNPTTPVRQHHAFTPIISPSPSVVVQAPNSACMPKRLFTDFNSGSPFTSRILIYNTPNNFSKSFTENMPFSE